MIELIIMDYLMSQLPGVQISTGDTAAKPAQRITIERTGGREEEHVRRATVAIQSYGATQYDAAALHERLLEAMHGITARPELGACTLNQEYFFPDLETKENRYQAVFDIVYYGG